MHRGNQQEEADDLGPPTGGDGSITHWLGQLKTGDDAAVQQIWERFFVRAAALARRKLGDRSPRMVDEEDLALSAFHALCRGAREERFSRLVNRDDLWQVLAMITARKTANALRREERRREVSAADHDLDQADGDFLDTLSLTSAEMLSRLDPRLRSVALLKLEGFTNAEIGVRMDRSLASIERYLKMIRLRWA